MLKKLILSLLIMGSFFNCKAMPNLLTFARTAFKEIKTVGALTPLSKYAVQELTKDLDVPSKTPRKILEIGAGIGNITQVIVDKLQPGDVFDVVEIMPNYCTELKRKFGNNPQVRIHQVDFLQWESPEKQYDLVISTVPHIALGFDFAQKSFPRYEQLTNGTFCFVLYALIHRFKYYDSGYRKIMNLFDQFCSTHQGQSTLVMRNIPPVWVYRIDIKQQSNMHTNDRT